MQKISIKLPEIKLVGITCRTSNAEVFNSAPEDNKIVQTIQKYFANGCSEKIAHRSKPRTTYGVYTNYESDFNGEYTYFIGEEVSSLEDLPEGFETITIPIQNYAKFTNEPGPMPSVCIDMWKNILGQDELMAQRGYIADFEVYDIRSKDQQNAVLDIYIGVK